jgi:tripartite-type tricarboxylate transporter receptor subunit TctC
MKTFAVFALFCGALCTFDAGAQEYPAKPVKLVVSFTPGGGADTTARVFADGLSELWKHQVFVENKPGAGGSIGAHEVFKAPPDGYTLLLATNTHIVNQVVYSNLGFDFTKDFTPIAIATSGPMVIAVNSAKVPARDLREFIAMLKSAPGKYSYASCNVGSPHHFSMEMLKSIEHLDALHIPHKGCGPAVADTVAGHIDTVITTLPAAVPFFKEGRLRPIALMSSTRSVAAPQIPTVRESGIPELKDFSLDNYYGFMAPPGTPQAIAAKIEADVLKIAEQPEVRKKLENSGMDMLVLNATDMMKLIRSDYGKYSAAAKAANIKAE